LNYPGSCFKRVPGAEVWRTVGVRKSKVYLGSKASTPSLSLCLSLSLSLWASGKTNKNLRKGNMLLLIPKMKRFLFCPEYYRAISMKSLKQLNVGFSTNFVTSPPMK
jgi:hypothetical protein